MSDIIKFPPVKKVLLYPKAAALREADGSYWKSALDCLKELVHDIENGEQAAPDVLYVAMQCVDPNNAARAAYPSYCWTSLKSSTLVMSGLLARHQAKLTRG
jgi:hypothetical protein